MPTRIKQARFLADREWIPILQDAHKHYGSGKAEVVAKVWYLSCVMQYPLYGCTFFAASYRGYWSYGNQILIGVHSEGLCLGTAQRARKFKKVQAKKLMKSHK